MFGNILHFIINILFTLFGIALLIRAWMFAIRLHPFNPYSQALLRITDWLVVPLKKLIPSGGRLDWPSIIAAWLVALIYLGNPPIFNGAQK